MKTLVENISGARKFFSYVGAHGVYLDASEDTVVDGDLRSALASGRGRYTRKTELAALQSDCDDGIVCLTEVADDCCSSSSSS